MTLSPLTTVSPTVMLLPTVRSSARLKARSVPVRVTVMLPSSLLKSTEAPGLTFSAAAPLALMFQPALATSETSFNCDTFTASVSSVPTARSVIFLPPILMPSPLITGPPLLMVMLFRSVRFCAMTRFSWLPSLSTRRFAPVEASPSASSPETVNGVLSPSVLAMVLPVLPAKLRPSV